jgi:hypothetical protein
MDRTPGPACSGMLRPGVRSPFILRLVAECLEGWRVIEIDAAVTTTTTTEPDTGLAATAGEVAKPLPRELAPEVIERIVAELAGRGPRVIDCLRTAEELVGQAVADQRGLRLAESAGYNLREALDTVVAGRTPASGGLPAILDAWNRYQVAAREPGADSAASLAELEDVLRQVADNRDRNSYHGARLLAYLREQTGVDPLSGDADPVVQYASLRKAADTAVHDELALDAVTDLYDRTVAWFTRLFTPPGTVVNALRALARQGWKGTEQVDRLRGLATNPHHMRLFLGQLLDPAWLTALYEADLVGLPRPNSPWPVAGLLDGLGRTAPADVAILLERLVADSRGLPREQQVGARFELLRVASHLGAFGHPVVARVAVLHPGNRAVRALAVSVVKRADPADLIVEQVADALLSGRHGEDDRYYVAVLLEQLEAGLDAKNVVARTRMLAAKMRRAARDPQAGTIVLDIAKLTAELRDEHGYVPTLAHYLARALPRARALGVPTSEPRTWTNEIAGEVGERINCRVLAGAEDVPLQDKIDHVARRLASSTATGDDRDLVADVVSADPPLDVLALWATAMGTPSDAPTDPDAALPADWARAWRWSMVLPDSALVAWRDPIAQVTARHGAPDIDAIENRSSPPDWFSGQSPYTEEELEGLAAIEAATRVAGWRPESTSTWSLISARELARTVEAVVKKHPDEWSTNAVAVVTALREPVYILHYFDALTDRAAAVAPYASSILEAAELVRHDRWKPTILGHDDFDFEPDWKNVDAAAVRLVAALANNDADLAGRLDLTWSWTLDLVDRTPETEDDDVSSSGSDAVHRAINSRTGQGLEAMLALAGWESRNTATVRPDFTQVLDEILRMTGRLAMEYRAILALHRVPLENVVPAWLEANVPTLFSDDQLGRDTFDLTLKYSTPTKWFCSHLRDELYAAARRKAERAVVWLLVFVLNEEHGYGLSAIIEWLQGDSAALGSAADQIAALVQFSGEASPELTIATEFWRFLIEADRRAVPAEVLRSCGRWSLVEAVSDEVWSDLMLRTLDHTKGDIDLPIEVADRCKAASESQQGSRIMVLLLGKGDPWERDYVARAAVEMLRSRTTPLDGDSTLQTRLIELGYYEAAGLGDQTPDS